jgi:hypothetical protein
MESMKHLEPQISLLIECVLRHLDNFAESSQAIDLGYWIQLFAFDVVGAVSFGKSFDFVSSGSDNGMFIRLERAMLSVGWVMHAEWFFWLHQNVIMPCESALGLSRFPHFFLGAKSPVGASLISDTHHISGGSQDTRIIANY